MADAAADTKPATDTKADRPEYIPEKFWTGNVEESVKKMAGSYTELEKKLSTPKVEPKLPALGDAPKSAGDEDTLEIAIGKAGLDPNGVGVAFGKDGKLADEQYAALRMQGWSRAQVNDAMRGKLALAQATQKEIQSVLISAAGGQEQASNLITWANATLRPELVAKMTNDLADPSVRDYTVQTLMQMHRNAVGAGKSAPLETGKAASGDGAGAFRSTHELHSAAEAARNDPSKRDAYLARLNATPGHLLGALPFKS